MTEDFTEQAEQTLNACRAAGLTVTTVESCTGGLVAASLTAIAGSSDVVERGFVTYSNDAKNQLVGVPMALIETHGAVSEEVARAMVEGAIAHCPADIAVSITGIARVPAAAPRPSGSGWFISRRRGAAPRQCTNATYLRATGARCGMRRCGPRSP